MSFNILYMNKVIMRGTVTRVAQLNASKKEFTLRVKSTQIGGYDFTIAEDVCCEVDTFHFKKEISDTLTNLSVGDSVVVKIEPVDDKWQVISLKHKPNRGRNLDEWLKALEEEIDRQQLHS